MKTYEQQLKSYNINKSFQKVFSYIIIFSILMILTLYAYYIFGNMNKDKEIMNTVELHAKYKNYILIHKQRNDSLYEFTLMNPYTTERDKVFINEWVYYNLYFVGDTIKKFN